MHHIIVITKPRAWNATTSGLHGWIWMMIVAQRIVRQQTWLWLTRCMDLLMMSSCLGTGIEIRGEEEVHARAALWRVLVKRGGRGMADFWGCWHGGICRPTPHRKCAVVRLLGHERNFGASQFVDIASQTGTVIVRTSDMWAKQQIVLVFICILPTCHCTYKRIHVDVAGKGAEVQIMLHNNIS